MGKKRGRSKAHGDTEGPDADDAWDGGGRFMRLRDDDLTTPHERSEAHVDDGFVARDPLARLRSAMRARTTTAADPDPAPTQPVPGAAALPRFVSEAGVSGAGAESSRFDARFGADWTPAAVAAARSGPASSPDAAKCWPCEPLGTAEFRGAASAALAAVRRNVTSVDEVFTSPVASRWRSSTARAALGPGGGSLTRAQAHFAAWLAAYADVHIADAYAMATMAGGSCYDWVETEVLPIIVAHAVDHVFRSRRQVVANNSMDKPPRDQGFVRPRVVFIVPFRHHALHLVQLLADLSPATTEKNGSSETVAAVRLLRADRLTTEYGDDEDVEEPDSNDTEALSARERKSREARRRALRAPRPRDHTALFGGSGEPRRNCDDRFCLGVRASGAALRPFVPFMRADYIVASPLGLRQQMGAVGAEEGEALRPCDWLASVELCVVVHATALQMQNWRHLQDVMCHMNALPRDPGDTDFERVRSYALEGLSAHLRQTVFVEEHASAEAAALIRRRCANVAGIVRASLAPAQGLGPTTQGVRLLCRRSPAASAAADADARFELFVREVLPELSAQPTATILFVPSYLDYVRVRNCLRADGIDAAEHCEYTDHADAARARARLASGEASVFVHTERAHFFHRHALRGARHLCLYQLPVHAHFFRELVDAVEVGGQAGTGAAPRKTVVLLYSSYDALRLERLLGPARAARLIKSREDTFAVNLEVPHLG